MPGSLGKKSWAKAAAGEEDWKGWAVELSLPTVPGGEKGAGELSAGKRS